MNLEPVTLSARPSRTIWTKNVGIFNFQQSSITAQSVLYGTEVGDTGSNPLLGYSVIRQDLFLSNHLSLFRQWLYRKVASKKGTV